MILYGKNITEGCYHGNDWCSGTWFKSHSNICSYMTYVDDLKELGWLYIYNK